MKRHFFVSCGLLTFVFQVFFVVCIISPKASYIPSYIIAFCFFLFIDPDFPPAAFPALSA